MRDLESLRKNLVLNGIIATEEEENLEPKYSLQPGWDDEEANHLHQSGGDE